MSGMVLRWGVPALVTVIGGTSLAISATSAGMVSDLMARTAGALTDADRSWASVSFDGRDAIVTGVATEQPVIDGVIAKVAAVHGVRSVRSNVTLAEVVSPYPFVASAKNGSISLAGGVPDETAHAEIVLATASDDDELRLLAGAPPRGEWRAAVDYGLAHVNEFDEGEFVLSDLKITITGRARSAQAYDALTTMGESPAPTGAEIVKREIKPPLASPFEWHATFDGATVTVSGFTPTTEFAEALRTDGIDGHPVSTSLVLASGAPEDFEATARTLLENLVRLEEGRADISDSTVTLSGAPPDQSTIDSIRLATAPFGAVLTLEPPRVASYAFSAMRTNGSIALDGFVPSEETRARLGAMEGVDASGLELARGAPNRFDSGVEYGLALVAKMSEGRFTLENTALAVEGRAATATDYTDIETTLDLGAPQGLILSSAAVRPPLADPFVWSVEKDADGVRMEGFVPSAEVRELFATSGPPLDRDSTVIADGYPEGFEAEAAAALAVLPLLDTGRISYDGTSWSMSGAVQTPQAGFDAERAFAATGLREAGWTFALDLPDAAPAVALPIIDPYVWRAQKGRDGNVTFGGFVPTEGLKQILVGRAGEGAVDNSNLGAGYPENFIAGTLTGLDALLLLDEGSLGFDGRVWSLSGQVATASARHAVEGVLQAGVDPREWQVTIQALDAAPVIADYTWSATKSADGRMSLAGYVATEELRRFIAVRAGDVARDTTEVASGEPVGFIGNILAGLEALTHFSMGTVKYEDGGWTLAGVPRTSNDGELALAALDLTPGGRDAWVTALAAPAAPEPVVAEPAEPEPVEPETETAAIGEPSTGASVAEPDIAAAEQSSIETLDAPEATSEDAEQVASLPEPEAVVEPEAPAEPAPVARVFTFSAMKPLDGPIDLAGAVPADPARRFFGVIAGGVPTEGMTLSADLPPEFIASADAGIRLLAGLDAGEFGLEGDKWVFNGRVETDAQRDAVLAGLAATPQASSWETSVTLLPAIDVCRRHVAAFASRNAILFQSGSARMAEESFAAVDELAGYLAACPDATVHVEGHTDADGAEDLNLALSVARAEAVVDALIERGVNYQRLYAVGYGESLPIESNDTNAGKRANRRIAFTIMDEPQ